MTQKRLAEACGITEPAIRNYELDNRIPSYETLDDIADALHVNYYTLADPNLGGLIGVMHCFFRIEYVHGLRPVELEGKTALILDPSYNHIDTSILQPFLNRWLQARKNWIAGNGRSNSMKTGRSHFRLHLQQKNMKPQNPLMALPKK